MSDTSTSSTELGDVTFRHTHPAPRQLVFTCMTTPEHLSKFWGPPGISAPLDRIVLEPRAGGRFEATLVDESSGAEYPNIGVYTEVVAPERLAFREATAGAEGMTTEITFLDNGDGTTDAVTHQRNVPAMFRSPEAQAGMEAGFARFDEYLRTLV